MRLPTILELAQLRGHTVFVNRMDPNLVVLRGPGQPGEWDGLLHLAYRPGTQSGWTVHVWPCATRPGVPFLVDPMNPRGTAVIEPGQYRGSHMRGFHKGRAALEQIGPVTVRRDPDRDRLLEPGKLDVGLFKVNIHDIKSPSLLAGCIGLSELHMFELLTAFDSTVPFNGDTVSLTLLVG